MKVFVVHSVLRGKNDPSLVGLKIEKAFSRASRAEEYAANLPKGEQIIKGQLAEVRVGLTELDLDEE